MGEDVLFWAGGQIWCLPGAPPISQGGVRRRPMQQAHLVGGGSPQAAQGPGRLVRGLKRSLTHKLFCGLTCKLLSLDHIPQATTTRGQARPFACAAQVETVDV